MTAVLLVTCVCSSAHAFQRRGHHPPKRAAKEQIEQMEETWRSATIADDAAAMDKLLSDDYLGITAYGDLVTKPQELERMRKRQLVITQLDTTDLKIKLIGQIAIVTSLAQLTGEMDGKPINGSFRSTRVYQHLTSGGVDGDQL